jgi:hypothetical protein
VCPNFIAKAGALSGMRATQKALRNSGLSMALLPNSQHHVVKQDKDLTLCRATQGYYQAGIDRDRYRNSSSNRLLQGGETTAAFYQLSWVALLAILGY